ncbi:MAG TPA: addiction module protein [Terracidiphilus sp.]|jgi:putative addiction module component (TIGR02574 family)
MEHSYEEVHQLAHALPEEERVRLANSLYDSVGMAEDQEGEAEVSAAWDAEIRRRLDEIDSGAAEMISEEEFFARMDARIKAKQRE